MDIHAPANRKLSFHAALTAWGVYDRGEDAIVQLRAARGVDDRGEGAIGQLCVTLIRMHVTNTLLVTHVPHKLRVD
ncbi:hypothetical protein PInf_017922 [Phytophthora infestans]|nr:hypothetical protein PInf_017922 [Phytophthora infestans]